MTTIQALRADAKHYNYSNGKRWYGHPGFWVVAVYRFGHWAGNLRFKPFSFFLLAVYFVLNFPVRFVMHVDLSRRAKIGGGLCLHHPQNILIPETRIGQDVTIFQEVTIGRGPTSGLPQVGSNVMLYSGAKVLGGVVIGDDCEIGANVVVTKDVPAHCVVAVAPARAIPKATIAVVRQGLKLNQPDEVSGVKERG